MKRQATQTVHFDKKLTSYNTMYAFVRFCLKGAGRKNMLFANCAFVIFSLLSVLHVFSVSRRNEYLIRWFCPERKSDFDNTCFAYAQTIRLIDKYKEVLKDTNLIIEADSPKSYVQYVFPNHQIRAPEYKMMNKHISIVHFTNKKSKSCCI